MSHEHHGNEGKGKLQLREKAAARATVMIDYEEICKCGHRRYEHSRDFGCMQWDIRRRLDNEKATGWCTCDGFRPRKSFTY